MATIFQITAFLLKIGHVGPLHCEKNATARKVNSYYTLAISYCTFCVGKRTILGPGVRCVGWKARSTLLSI